MPREKNKNQEIYAYVVASYQVSLWALCS